MKHVLITGGAGFIAYHLSLKLQEKGYKVSGLDNFNDYYDVTLKRRRAEMLKEKGIDVHFGDLKSASGIDVLLSHARPDIVIHLGAYAGVRHSMEDPHAYIDNNIKGTQNLIDACEKYGVEKVVYASTSCTMAGQPLPWKESDLMPGQLNPYGYSKRTNELQFQSSNIPNSIGLRFFTVYGPWGRPDMALFQFTNHILKGTALTAFNDGNMVRDFTYVDDIVQGICIVVEKDLPNNEVYNIGNGKQVQLMDFIKYIGRECGKEPVIEYAPKHPADTQETWSDTTKLQALGYKSTTDIEEGVRNFVKWYRSYYNV